MPPFVAVAVGTMFIQDTLRRRCHGCCERSQVADTVQNGLADIVTFIPPQSLEFENSDVELLRPGSNESPPILSWLLVKRYGIRVDSPQQIDNCAE